MTAQDTTAGIVSLSLDPARGRRAGNLLFTGAIAALGEDGLIKRPGDVRGQACLAFERLGAVLRAHGGTVDDVVSVTSFHDDPRTIDQVLDAGRDVFSEDPPAWTQVGCVGSQHVGGLVTLRAIAHLGAGKRQSITPDSQAWRRAYPMAAACRKGDLVFIAGQTAAESDGRIQRPLDHRRQARRAYDRICEILELVGGSFDDVLDFTSFHHDIRGAAATLEDVYMPDVIGEIPSERAATTSHIGATGLIRPDVLGVYGAIADVSQGARVGCAPEMITWNDNGRYPIAGAARKESGRLITVSGQVSSGPDGNILHPGDLEAQLRFIFEEIEASIGGLGATMRQVTEVCSFHKDPRSYDLTMRVAREFFDPAAPPAWSFVASPGLWLEGYQHEIAAFAVVD